MSPIERLQLDLAGRADAAFPYVAVTVMRPRSAEEAILIETKMNNALAGFVLKNGKAGLVMIVGMPDLHCPDQDAVGPQLQLLPSIRIIENPVINMGAIGTGESAEEVLFAAMKLFHNFVDGEKNNTLLVARRPSRPLLEFIEKGQVAYDLFLERLLPQKNDPKTCSPKITGDATAVVITCADPLALVYYTVDGSYPSPTNPTAKCLNAILVTEGGNPLVTENGYQLVIDPAPFAVAIPTLVRAVAYNPNKQASNLAAKEITS